MPDDQTSPGRDAERRDEQRRTDDMRGRPHEEDPNTYENGPREGRDGPPSGAQRAPDNPWLGGG